MRIVPAAPGAQKRGCKKIVGWLQACEVARISPNFKPPEADSEIRFAVQAWNQLGGELEWQGVPFVVEMIGIRDVEILIAQLTAIRDHMKKDAGNA